MYCSKCGTEIDDNSEYCYNCGAKIASNQNVVNNNSGEEKLKKYLPLILIILSLPLMFIFGFILMFGSGYWWQIWGTLMVIAAFLSFTGGYLLYINKKLYGRMLVSIGIFLGLIFSLLTPIYFILFALPNIIALILDYHWFK